jgi:hypothetical protein
VSAVFLRAPAMLLMGIDRGTCVKSKPIPALYSQHPACGTMSTPLWMSPMTAMYGSQSLTAVGRSMLSFFLAGASAIPG